MMQSVYTSSLLLAAAMILGIGRASVQQQQRTLGAEPTGLGDRP
jgi:hypothetical protein